MNYKQAKQKYSGKWVECLATGELVEIQIGYVFGSPFDEGDEIWAYDDEGQPVALLFLNGQEAQIYTNGNERC